MSVRTSESSRLEIGWVEAPAPWRIGITIAPGKRGISNYGPRWERSLDADLAEIVASGVRVLVCLVQDFELDHWKITELPDAARRHGLDFVRCPIRDQSVPSLAQARALVADLTARRESTILVHCIGGLGRSGVVVGCVLRSLGIAPDEVFRRLAKARTPRCPETPEQRAFVEAFSVYDPEP